MTTQQISIDYGERGTVIVVPDATALAELAAETLVSASAKATTEGRSALIALSGGSTPKKMGQVLASDGFRERAHWDAMEIFWGDERWVRLSSQESNAGEAKRVFLDAVDIPTASVHPWETEGDVTPEQSAENYAQTIVRIAGTGDTPVFDLILLGMGDDGHTASLFPGTSAINEKSALTLAHRVEKLDDTRLTFTPRLINAAASVVFLVTGAGKAAMLNEVLDGGIDVDRLPAQVVRPESGALLWLVDAAAATELDRKPIDV